MSKVQIGIRLKELRAGTGLSQEAFANQVGIARSYYAECETGKRNISYEKLERIIAGFNLTPREFFDSPTFDEIIYTATKLDKN